MSKQKKVPQRGLGVAQLEKIILEEQQQQQSKDPPSCTTLSPTNSSFISVPPLNLHQSPQPSPFIPFPPPLDLPPPNSLFRPPPLLRNIDVPRSTIVPLPNSVKWPPITSPRDGSIPKLWYSCDYKLDKENSGVDPCLPFQTNLSFPYESNPISALHSLMPRSQSFQEPSAMVNASLATSSSSVISFQMEPPSNQSYYGNYRHIRSYQEKTVGVKRQYPFSLDSTPVPSFHFKLPTIGPPVSDESASYGNGGGLNLEPSHLNFRESLSCSTSIPEMDSNKRSKEYMVCGGDFLTLGLPTPTSQSKQHSGYLPLPNHELPDFDSLPFQGSAEDPDPKLLQSRPNGWTQQLAFYNFLPPAKQATTTTTTSNGEGETIDLSLKL